MIQHLSYSGLSTYRTCGEQFRLTKIEELGSGAPGWYNAGGTGVHYATEAKDFASFGSTTEGREDWTFDDYFDLAIEEAEESSGVDRTHWKTAGRKSKALPNGEDEQWWRTNGPSFVASWSRWLTNSPYVVWVTPDGQPAIELQYEVMIGEVPNRGTIDRVLESPDGTLVVVDLKTGKPPKDQTQLATYAHYLRSRGWDVSRGGYWMARDGILTGEHNLLPLLGDRLIYDYDQVWRAVDQAIFPATPSGLCANHCEVAQFCYAGGKLTDPSHVPFLKEENV